MPIVIDEKGYGASPTRIKEVLEGCSRETRLRITNASRPLTEIEDIGIDTANEIVVKFLVYLEEAEEQEEKRLAKREARLVRLGMDRWLDKFSQE